jgi:hypothetical protein
MGQDFGLDAFWTPNMSLNLRTQILARRWNWRATAWEIHPVTAMNVVSDTRQIRLANYFAVICSKRINNARYLSKNQISDPTQGMICLTQVS